MPPLNYRPGIRGEQSLRLTSPKSQEEQLLAGHFESLTTKKQATLLAGQISFLLEGAISRAGLEGNSVLLLRARTMINDMLKAL